MPFSVVGCTLFDKIKVIDKETRWVYTVLERSREMKKNEKKTNYKKEGKKNIFVIVVIIVIIIVVGLVLVFSNLRIINFFIDFVVLQ